MLEKVRFALAGTLVLIAGLFMLGCGGGDDKASDTRQSTGEQAPGGEVGTGTASANRELRIEEKDFSFVAEDTVRGGLVKISANNTGKEPHQAQIVRLNDGVTQQQFAEALRQPNFDPLFKIVTFMGGPNTIAPGASQVAYSNLSAGNYALLDFLESEDGMPHFAKGMIKMFTVTQGDSGDASPPKTAGSVTMADFNFLGDVSTLKAEKTTLEIKNGGPQPHELTVIKLNNGLTVDELKTMLNSETPPASPPPMEDAGGMGAIQANATGYVELDLKAGKYAFVCFVPDVTTGKPHAALGMIKAFEVK